MWEENDEVDVEKERERVGERGLVRKVRMEMRWMLFFNR